ncbi:MAG: hypothetical protein AAF721_05285 [Myxococcota bacterium]
MTSILFAAMLVGAAPTAEPSFEALIEEARTHFDAGRHSEAAAALEAAYGQAPEPDVLFNWANAERLAGHCERAVELYDRFIAQTAAAAEAGDALSQQYATVAEQRRDECAESLPPTAVAPLVEAEMAETSPTPAASRPASVPEAKRPDPPRVVDSAPTDSGPADEPHRRADALGWTLTSIGAAGVGAGAAMLAVAYRRDRNALTEPSHEAYLDQVQGASRLSVAGWSVLGVGAAVALGGVVRLVWVARRGRVRTRAAGTVALRPGLGSLQMRF